MDDPQEAEKQEMQDALVSRDEIYDLAFTLQTQYFKTNDGGVRLSVVSHIGLKDLRFRMADGKHYNEFRFLPSFAAIHHHSHDTYMTPLCYLRNRCDLDFFTPVDRLLLRSVLDPR